MPQRKRKPDRNAPTCAFCSRTGDGVQFAIFNPRFKPFGTACVDCERDLPEGTVVPPKPATAKGGPA